MPQIRDLSKADIRNVVEVSTKMNIHDDPNCCCPGNNLILVTLRGEISLAMSGEKRECLGTLDSDQIHDDITDLKQTQCHQNAREYCPRTCNKKFCNKEHLLPKG